MTIVLVAVGLLTLVAALVWLGRRERADADTRDEGMHRRRIGDGIRHLREQKERYAHMTAALLAQTPDDQLLEAVLANLWAKMAPDLSDAPAVLRALSPQRQALFALYAVTGGVKADGFAGLLDGPDAAFAPMAVDALGAMDMPQTQALLRDALAAQEKDAWDDPYLETFHGEEGKARMAAYIRAHARDFVDLA